MAISAAQLDFLASTLRLVTGNAGPVQPGQLVDAKILSSLTELSGVDLGLAIPLTRPVQLDVRWRVLDERGVEQRPNEGFVASNGLAGPVVDFVLKPPIVAMTQETQGTVTWRINATVTIAAEGAGSVTRALSVPVELVKLEIPVLLALFRLRNYQAFQDPTHQGFVLMVVPRDGSVLQGISGPFNELMVKLEDAVRPLRAIASLAKFLTGISTLRQALFAQPLARLKAVREIDDFQDVHMRKDTFLGIDPLNPDLRAQDAISSLILMGPCGTRVGCFDDENQSLSDGEWAFNVVTGPEMITLVPDLSLGKPPPSIPPDRVFVRQAGGRNFNDSMTSMMFDPPRARGEPDTGRLCAPVATEQPPVADPVIV